MKLLNWIKNLFKTKESPKAEAPSKPEVKPSPSEIPSSSKPIEPQEKMGLFADISRYEPCDFSKFNGKFLIFKATDGGTWVDPTMQKNIDECKKRGINYGVYHFYRTGTDPIVQAKLFISKVGLENLKSCFYEPILDFETVSNPRVGQVQDWKMLKADLPDAIKFLDYVYEQTGRRCIFYTYESLLDSLDLPAVFVEKCPKLWIARYSLKKPVKFDPWLKPWAWQYSDGTFSDNPIFKDSFNGIGRCDANILWDEI